MSHILRFKFKNYGSFEKGELDFEFKGDAKRNVNNLRFFKVNDKRLSPVFSFYGANACGKTTLLDALYKHFFMINVRGREVSSIYKPHFTTPEKESKSEIEFISKGAIYKHEITYNREGVLEEVFLENGEVIFEIKKSDRNVKEIDNEFLSKIFKKFNSYSGEAKDELLAIFKERFGKFVILGSFVKTFSRWYGGIIPEPSLISFKRDVAEKEMPFGLTFTNGKNPKINLERVNLLLNALQRSFEKVEENNEDYFTIYKEGETEFKLPLKEESNGIIRIFNYATGFIDALERGQLCIVDEIDSMLHPMALEFIVECFKNKEINKRGAVLLFTSHNYDVIDVLDYENIFIVEKSYNKSKIISIPPQPSKEKFKKELRYGYFGSQPGVTTLNTFANRLEEFLKKR